MTITLKKITEVIRTVDMYGHIHNIYQADKAIYHINRLGDDLMELSIYILNSENQEQYLTSFFITDYYVEDLDKPTDE